MLTSCNPTEQRRNAAGHYLPNKSNGGECNRLITNKKQNI